MTRSCGRVRRAGEGAHEAPVFLIARGDRNQARRSTPCPAARHSPRSLACPYMDAHQPRGRCGAAARGRWFSRVEKVMLGLDGLRKRGIQPNEKSCESSDQGKPPERVGRKATGLRPGYAGYGRRAAERTPTSRGAVWRAPRRRRSV
jgi:hypothetical protein